MKKKVFIFLGIGLLSALFAVLEVAFIRIGAASPVKRYFFFLLLNLNIIALFALIFFIGKSLRGLYLERKHGVPGHRFKTKMVFLFVILTFIPSSLLFITASGIGTNYIERLFSPEFRRPIESSIELAKAVYEAERQKAIGYAELAKRGAPLPTGYKITHLAELPDDATDVIRLAFQGGPGAAEVVSRDGRDTIRAAVPYDGGALMLEYLVPPDITAKVEGIKEAYEDYLQLEAWNIPLKLNFLLILGFSALMIISLSIWAALRIAGRITEPVKALAEATAAVAAGNLGVRVALRGGKSKDEIGQLITSFNSMVVELSEGKKSLQTALSESDRRRLYLENILENIQSGVIFLNAKGLVAAVNPSAERILGLKPKDVIGKDYGAVLSGITSDALKTLIKGIRLESFTSIEKEVEAVVSEKKINLRVLITGLRDSAGGYLGLLVVFDDLTNLINAQRVLAWQEMARRIAHEIKNPLTPIKLSTERMLKKWQEHDPDFSMVFERSTQTIIREVEALKRLVDEFSRFGKMPEIKKSPTALKALAEEVIGLYRVYKNLALVLEAEDAVVDLDPEQIRRVLINLFDNAVEAMEESGGITVRIRHEMETNMVSVSVADTGPGIKGEDKEKLFLPYFSTKRHGTGLGLAIAYKIIAEHGGSIRVLDNKPKGSVFIIELPSGDESIGN